MASRYHRFISRASISQLKSKSSIKTPSSSPSTLSLPKSTSSPLSRIPSEVVDGQSLLLSHNAVAKARMTSSIGITFRNCRTFSQGSGKDNDDSNAFSFESADDFEKRIFHDQPGDSMNSLFKKLDRINAGGGMYSDRQGHDKFNFDEGDDESLSTLTDGLEGKLKDAATYFDVNHDEIDLDDYTFRPDLNVKSGMTYTPEDLNLRKPAVWRPNPRDEFEVTTEEVLKQADFRNVRFLANFLTEAGIIIKRNKTGISAKAQRKVAREIKTARAFGLLPFTTMGTKSFVFGQTMEDLDKDFEVNSYDSRVDIDDIQEDIA